MAEFIIHAINRQGETAKFFYDNESSALLRESGEPVAMPQPRPYTAAPVVSKDHAGRKDSPRVLKISLGLACNYACTYCNQKHVEKTAEADPEDVDQFLHDLTTTLTKPPERVEFWGGEPFVYWKKFKRIAEALRTTYPDAQFSVITNGSVLDIEKNEWLDRMGFSVGLSHDGPGYHARGKDPLDDPQRREAIMDLWRRLSPVGRISVNAMMHRHNTSRGAVQSWLEDRFGPDVTIGEGSFIDPYDEGGLNSTLPDAQSHLAYRRTAFRDLRSGRASKFQIAHNKISEFIESVVTARPASALGQKCQMDKPENMAVDLRGNLLTCQNVSAVATAPNGQPHKLGHITDLGNAALKSATHWSHRNECRSCPVLQLCKGSCMFLEGPLWDAACDAAYSDNLPFMAAAIEYLTGFLPVYIEGDFRESRKDLFGYVEPPEPTTTRRVIPIVEAKTG